MISNYSDIDMIPASILSDCEMLMEAEWRHGAAEAAKADAAKRRNTRGLR